MTIPNRYNVLKAFVLPFAFGFIFKGTIDPWILSTFQILWIFETIFFRSTPKEYRNLLGWKQFLPGTGWYLYLLFTVTGWRKSARRFSPILVFFGFVAWYALDLLFMYLF